MQVTSSLPSIQSFGSYITLIWWLILDYIVLIDLINHTGYKCLFISYIYIHINSNDLFGLFWFSSKNLLSVVRCHCLHNTKFIMLFIINTYFYFISMHLIISLLSDTCFSVFGFYGYILVYSLTHIICYLLRISFGSIATHA